MQNGLHAHDGKIDVRSKTREGATFYFDIARDGKEVSDQPVSVSDSKSEELTVGELRAIRVVSSELAGLKLYEVSKIEVLIDQIEDTDGISHWKKVLKTAAYHWDEARYRKLTEV